jgi:hypothetical protein
METGVKAPFHVSETVVCKNEILVKGIVDDFGSIDEVVHDFSGEFDCSCSHTVDLISRHILTLGELMNILSAKLLLVDSQSRLYIPML